MQTAVDIASVKGSCGYSVKQEEARSSLSASRRSQRPVVGRTRHAKLNFGHPFTLRSGTYAKMTTEQGHFRVQRQVTRHLHVMVRG
jgi:hypothetical protein